MSIRLKLLLIGMPFILLLCHAAAAQTWLGSLQGADEAPPNTSPGSGSVLLVLDGDTLLIDVSFTALSAPSTAAHIHCCSAPGINASVATQTPSFSAFPLNVTEGEHVQALDLTLATSFNSSFVTSSGGLAEARVALLSGLDEGNAYYNLHSAAFPGGELRANLLGLNLFSDGFEQEALVLITGQ